MWTFFHTPLVCAQRNMNDAEVRLVNLKNQFLEDARLELAKVEDDIAQNQQILTRRQPPQNRHPNHKRPKTRLAQFKTQETCNHSAPPAVRAAWFQKYKPNHPLAQIA